MTNILLIFGTRPEAIKLFPVVRALRARPGLRVRTCATGQHRAMLDQVLAIAGLVPDIDLDVMTPGQSLDRLTARLLVEIGGVLDRERPDLVIVQGDTTTAMAAALAAYYRRIPVGHVEAGLRSGDIHHPWPEEINRRIVAPIARHHWAPTDAAAAALRREGIDPATIRVTGNTVIDALHWTRGRIAADPRLAAIADRAIAPLAGRRILLVTAHRRENMDGGMARIAQALVQIAARQDVAILLPMHANPAIAAAMDAIVGAHPAIVRVPAFGYPDFVRALEQCALVLTDSGGVQEEAPALGKPVLVLRETTERPEGVAAGTARLVGTDVARIVSEVFTLLDDSRAYQAMARAHNPYGDGHAAERIAESVAHADRTPDPGAAAGPRLPVDA